MANLERTYNVPLRKGFSKAPRYRKAKKAVNTLKEFLVRHMKCRPEELRLGKMLNEKMWQHGIKNPPHHIKITVVKGDDGIVKAELFGHKYVDIRELKEKLEKQEQKKEEAHETEAKETETKEKTIDVKAEKETKPKKKASAKKPAEKKEAKPKKAAKKKAEE